MPLYDYGCDKCDLVHESLVYTSDEHNEIMNTKCECGGNTIKLPPVSNFHLKGGGWEKDGYVKR